MKNLKSLSSLFLLILVSVGLGLFVWADREHKVDVPPERDALADSPMANQAIFVRPDGNAAFEWTRTAAPTETPVARIPRVQPLAGRTELRWVPSKKSSTARTEPLDEEQLDASPERVALQTKAERVEYEANRRLAQYADRFGLSEDQQDVIFPLIAAMSPSFVPGMEAEGAIDAPVVAANTKELEEAIYESLDEEQREQMEEEIIDRDLWWDEILAVVDPANAPAEETMPATTEVSETVADASTVGGSNAEEVAPDRIGGNLFDLLNVSGEN